jgi:hypothetical protein
MRKLCTDEVGEVKNEKKKTAFCNLKKSMSFYCSFWDAPLAFAFQ